MVTDFLKKYADEIIEQLTALQAEIKEIKDSIIEYQTLYSALTINSEKYSNDFSPRNTNAKNSEKVTELIEKIDNDKLLLEQKEKELEELQTRLNEINAISSEKKTVSPEVKPVEVEFNVLDELKRIKQYIYMDPHRAGQEIERLIERIKDK